MSWSNPTHSGNFTNQDNMDSADSSNQVDKRLCVRNYEAPPLDTNWRAEIKETGAGAQALRVNGKVNLVKPGTTHALENCGTIEGTVWNVGQPEEYGSLSINTDSGAPNVEIGNGTSMDAGNIVTIGGKHIWIGNSADEQYFRAGIAGPVAMATENTQVGRSIGALHATGRLQVNSNFDTQEPPHSYEDGVVATEFLDAISDSGSQTEVKIGTAHASKVRIGRSNLQTVVNGALVIGQGSSPATEGLVVTGGMNVTGGIQLHGGTLLGGGVNLHQIADINATSLDIDGSADILNDLEVHGNIDLNDGNLTTRGDIETLNLAAGGNISADGELRGGTLSVTDEASVGGKLEVVGDMTDGNLSINGSSLNAKGASFSQAVSMAGSLAVTGQTTHGNTVNMQGQHILMGGSGAGEVFMKYASNRLEIYVGGTLRFYIDSTGGHNA
jgi:hypothetical protein